MLNSQGLGEMVSRKKDAYQNNPQALQQRYQQSQELVDLLALQQLKSEKEAAARNMQMQMQQNPATIAQQREQEVLGMIKQEQGRKLGDVAQRTAGTLGQINKKAQQNVQRTAKQGLPAMGGPRKPAMMAGGGIVAFQEGSTGPIEGEAETVSVTDAIAALGEDAFNYIKENPAEAAAMLGITLLTGGTGLGAGLLMRGGLTALRSQGVRSAIQKLMRSEKPDTAPPVTRVKRGAAERDRPVDPGKQLVESGVRSDKQLVEVGTGPRGMVPYGAPRSRDTLSSTKDMGRAASGLGQFLDPEQEFEKEYENLYPPDPDSFPPEDRTPTQPPASEEPVDFFAGIGDLKPVKPEFGTMVQDAAKKRAGVLGLAGASDDDMSKEAARDAEQERVMGLLDKEGKLGVKDEQLRRLQDLQERQMDPDKLRKQRLTAGLLGAAGRGSTALAGFGAGAFNQRVQQEAAERKALTDQFGIENEKIQLDFDITAKGIESGMDALKINSQERQAVARDLQNAAQKDIDIGLQLAEQEFEAQVGNRSAKLEEAATKAEFALEQLKNDANERDKLLELYQELTTKKFEVAQELQSNSGFSRAMSQGDFERAKQALTQTEVAIAHLNELSRMHAVEEAYEKRLIELGVPIPQSASIGYGAAEIDKLLQTYAP
jgi:hypothetical protein